MNRTTSVTLSAALVLIAGSSFLSAGPLNPPGGPVLQSMKPLSEIEPRKAVTAANTPGSASAMYRITLPGSYYLTENLYGVAGKAGIVIESSDVTLDLNGFQLQGAGGTTDGVVTLSGLKNVTVKNGVVSGWGEDGVDLISGQTAACTLRGLTCSNNTGRGMRAGANSVVEGCIADSNGSIGIDVGTACTVTGCSTTRNTGNGIDTGGSSNVIGCTARSCANGIATGSDSRVEGCVSVASVGGVAVGNESVVSGCTISSNIGTGLTFGSRSLITGNNCSGNGTGVASPNLASAGSDSRIEGNMCVGANVGISVTGTGNFIVRNTCSGNTVNWSLVANNVYGPIVDRSASASPAVGGNTAASALGTTDPNANFTY